MTYGGGICRGIDAIDWTLMTESISTAIGVLVIALGEVELDNIFMLC